MKKSFLLIVLFCFSVTTLFADNSKVAFMKCLKKIEVLKQQGVSYNLSCKTNKKKNDISATVYIKGNKVRINTLDNDTFMNILNNEMYVCSKKDKTAKKMALNTDLFKRVTLDIFQEKADELMYIKDISKNGYMCKVFKSQKSKQDVRYFMTHDYGFPTYIKESDYKSNITNFQTNSINDILFELPEDVNLIDMINITDFNNNVSKDKSNVYEKFNDFFKNKVKSLKEFLGI